MDPWKVTVAAVQIQISTLEIITCKGAVYFVSHSATMQCRTNCIAYYPFIKKKLVLAQQSLIAYNFKDAIINYVEGEALRQME